MKIIGGHLRGDCLGGKRANIRIYAEKREEQKSGVNNERENYAVSCDMRGFCLVAAAERAGYKDVYADPRTDAERDHQDLHWKCEGERA